MGFCAHKGGASKSLKEAMSTPAIQKDMQGDDVGRVDGVSLDRPLQASPSHRRGNFRRAVHDRACKTTPLWPAPPKRCPSSTSLSARGTKRAPEPHSASPTTSSRRSSASLPCSSKGRRLHHLAAVMQACAGGSAEWKRLSARPHPCCRMCPPCIPRSDNRNTPLPRGDRTLRAVGPPNCLRRNRPHRGRARHFRGGGLVRRIRPVCGADCFRRRGGRPGCEEGGPPTIASTTVRMHGVRRQLHSHAASRRHGVPSGDLHRKVDSGYRSHRAR